MTDTAVKSNIRKALDQLQLYIEQEAYAGFDPYDGLKSPLFKLSIFRCRKFQFLAQQFIKRFPVNLRGMLGIPKGVNPVTLGLCIQGYSQRYKGAELENKCRPLIEKLKLLAAKKYTGICWGYDFDWQARYASIPAYEPTIVATGIITNALYIYYGKTGDNEVKDMISGAAQFAVKDLNRTYDGSSFCFSYSPFDHQIVFNASLKGARLLAQAYRISKSSELRELAIQAVAYVAARQLEDGRWTYAGKNGKWTDNYHTGYVLDCLDEVSNLCETNQFEQAIKKGIEFYQIHFFEADGAPKFYAEKKYPIDCTSGAQSILTLNRFGTNAKAEQTAGYLIRHMQAENGGFYFRKYQWRTNKVLFMRWSAAWMFAALSTLCAESNSVS